MNDRKDLGIQGENTATAYLQRKQYHILKRNYHSAYGEIDIIARKNDVLVFVEVKTRSGSLDTGLSSVSRGKQKKIINTAQIYLSRLSSDTLLETRFDVISLTPAGDGTFAIKHLKDAFRPDYSS